jgi:hypothetical protein
VPWLLLCGPLQGAEAPVIVWDFASRRQLYNLFGMKHGVTYLTFSPDERFLAAAGADKMLFLWDMEVGGGMVGGWPCVAPRLASPFPAHPCKHVPCVPPPWHPQTGEQVFGKAQVTPVSFLAWGLVESAGRRNKYTLCFGVGREVGPSCHWLRDGTVDCIYCGL